LFGLESYDQLLSEKVDMTCIHKASFRYDPYHSGMDPISCFGDKSNFFKDKCALLFISVGQAYHEGSKFLSTIRLVNNYKFKSCDIVMADTLQRHNFLNFSPEQAQIYTRKAGDCWLKRNEIALEEFSHNYSIIRWDDLLSHENYFMLRKKIESEYKKNIEYEQAIRSNVEAYLERLKNTNPGVETGLLVDSGFKYLIEELPIVMPLWAEMGYDFIIYPKPITPAMKKTYDLFVHDNFQSKCRWIYLRFKKR